MSIQYFTSPDELQLAYRDEGSGTPILCLAGLTRNMADFNDVAATYQTRARIIRLDTRGRGLSDHAPADTYTVPHEAQDVLALLDHLGLEQAAILGTSRGGLIAMGLAMSDKARLSGVFLNDIGPVIEEPAMERIMGHLGHRPGHADYDIAAEALQKDNAAEFSTVPVEKWRIHAERLWKETPDGLALRYDPRLRDPLEAARAAGPLPDLWPFFDALEGVPLAMLRGENSGLLSEATFAEMQRRRPDALAATVADRGHVPFLDEPEAAALLTAFLDKLP